MITAPSTEETGHKPATFTFNWLWFLGFWSYAWSQSSRIDKDAEIFEGAVPGLFLGMVAALGIVTNYVTIIDVVLVLTFTYLVALIKGIDVRTSLPAAKDVFWYQNSRRSWTAVACSYVGVFSVLAIEFGSMIVKIVEAIISLIVGLVSIPDMILSLLSFVL